MGHRVDVSDSVAGFVERVGSSGKEIIKGTEGQAMTSKGLEERRGERRGIREGTRKEGWKEGLTPKFTIWIRLLCRAGECNGLIWRLHQSFPTFTGPQVIIFP